MFLSLLLVKLALSYRVVAALRTAKMSFFSNLFRRRGQRERSGGGGGSQMSRATKGRSSIRIAAKPAYEPPPAVMPPMPPEDELNEKFLKLVVSRSLFCYASAIALAV